MIILRPDQQQLTNEIYTSFSSGNRNVLAVLPTGGGKSVIVSGIVETQHYSGMNQCIIAHRKELVGQMSMHIANRGIKHRIVGSKNTIAQITNEHRREFNGRSFINPDCNTTVASIDTLIARKEQLKDWAQQINFWTIDEAHHVLAENKWGAGVAMFPHAYGLGVTATPRRADGKGLGSHHDGVFDDMVIGPDMRTLIDLGALSDYQIVVPESDFEIDEAQLAPSGDWSTKTMREASKKSHIVGDVVSEYIKRAFGKRAICFSTDVETAGEMAANFNSMGIRAAAVSAKTPEGTRNEYIRRFREGTISVLVNVDLFGEGFDVPAVEVVIMARPTASLAVYLQQFGRALRVLQGKAYGLVIDHVSNWKRHGLPDKQHIWTLDRRDKRKKKERDPEEIDLTVCRECSRPYERDLTACPHCGAEPPLPDPVDRTPQKVDGDLMLLDIETLAKMRAAIQLESPMSVGERVGHVAGQVAARSQVNHAIERHQAQKRLEMAIDQWAGIQRWKGRSDRQAYKRFYLATGVDVLTAMTGSKQEMNSLADQVERWCQQL